MLSSSNIKLINSLEHKKYREKYNLFVIEGNKIVGEFLGGGMPVEKVFATPSWLKENKGTKLSAAGEVINVSENELKKVSKLKTPPGVLALVRIKDRDIDIQKIATGLSIGLESIRDPGNLGTIIRIAAWFNIAYIICSNDSVDVYNPKTVRSSMGALAHTNVIYTDLALFTGKLRKLGTPIYAIDLDGKSVYESKLSNRGLLLFGNESKGLSGLLEPFVSDKLLIPPSGRILPGIDSLNVAMSAAIICSEFRRKRP
ncbi:MAG TPA: RNA methyltransferase [Bacteroidales bacterium]|nr:RNA methyltransferase [Bacteroidales bacterium]